MLPLSAQLKDFCFGSLQDQKFIISFLRTVSVKQLQQSITFEWWTT